jgi:hypothetical protein
MYPRSSDGGTPIWLMAAIGVALVIGVYFVWSGLTRFMSANGNINAQVTAQAANATQTEAQLAIDLATPIPILTKTPTRPCLDFRVYPPVAIVHDCAKMSCATRQAMLTQGMLVCVWGTAPESTSWYQVNMRPTGMFPDIAYMSRDVLYALNPTPYPSRTFTPLPSVTPPPSVIPQPTARVSPTPTATVLVATASPFLPTVTMVGTSGAVGTS